VASRRERFGTCVQRSRDHREFQMPGVTSGAGFASALTRPSVSFLAAGSASNTASDGKLLLHMGSVKPQTLYIVLFFQMCCRALKLLIFPCLTGKSPAPRRFLSWFPQGYVRTIGIHAADKCTSQLLVWLDGEWRPRRTQLHSRCVRLYAPQTDESMPHSGAELWICVEGAEK